MSPLSSPLVVASPAVIAALGEWATRVTEQYGYVGLFVVMVIENLFPPIPSEVILPLAGFQVSQGALTFVGALLVATAGSLAGAFAIYAIGRYGGRPLVYRLGPLLRVSEAELDRADYWFDRRGAWIVLLGRLIPGARSIVSIPAGMSEMPLLRFTVLTTAGSLAWNAILISIGRGLGANWQAVSGVLDRASTIVLVLIVLATVGLVVWLARRRRAGSRGGGPRVPDREASP